MRNRQIQTGRHYAIRVPNVVRAPNSGGSTVVRAFAMEDHFITKDDVPHGFKNRTFKVKPREVLAEWPIPLVEGWSGPLVDTGTPAITVRQLPPYCPLHDPVCVYYGN